MRAWICAPLCDVHVLRQRQEAVSALVNETSFAVQALELLRKVPDLERLFQRFTFWSTLMYKREFLLFYWLENYILISMELRLI